MKILKTLKWIEQRFVPFSEFLEDLGDAEGVLTDEAARGLIYLGVLSRVTTRLRDRFSGEVKVGGDAALAYELECTIHGAYGVILSDSARDELEIGDPGFFRDEIASVIVGEGMGVPYCLQDWLHKTELVLETKPEESDQVVARSLGSYIPRQWVLLADGARILSEYNGGLQSEWWDALLVAGNNSSIQTSDWATDRGQQKLLDRDIRMWCDANGYKWPAPTPNRSKSEVTENGVELKAEIDRLQKRITELERECADLLKKAEVVKTADSNSAINSPTLQRIIKGVEQYPAWIAAQNQTPNLKTLLSWQESQQRRHGNASRVAHVAHHVIAEHFGLKP